MCSWRSGHSDFLASSLSLSWSSLSIRVSWLAAAFRCLLYVQQLLNLTLAHAQISLYHNIDQAIFMELDFPKIHSADAIFLLCHPKTCFEFLVVFTALLSFSAFYLYFFKFIFYFLLFIFLFSPLLVFFMEIWILPWRIGEALGALWAGSHFLGRNQVENRFPLWVETWASRHFVKPFEFLVSIGLMSFFWLIFYDLCYEGITPPLLNLYVSSTSQSLF